MITDAFDNSETLFGPNDFTESKNIYAINVLLYFPMLYLNICLRHIHMKKQEL